MSGDHVICTACGHQNPAGNRFCGGCGSPLPVLCPSCGAANPAGNRFCGSCGSALGDAPPPRPAASPSHATERRLVTILFADLVGSTSLAEQLDAEEVHEVVSRAQGALAAVVTQYRGSVAKYLGDGLMALFGAPVAHEDDAERAVLASMAMPVALEEVNRLRPAGIPPLALRVGITSGEVIAGAIAGTYDVIGDAANTAARLQSAADPGGVLVGEETMLLAKRRIRFGERKLLTLKGKADAVAAYPALGVREHLAERWEARGIRTPLVGRDEEMGMLVQAWDRARAGEGQLVQIVAEAGVGKSRLLIEGRELIRQRDGGIQMLRGRCLSYSQGISYSLVTDLIRNLCDLRESYPLERVQGLLERRVKELLKEQEPETVALAVDVLGTMVGLPPSPSLVAHADPRLRQRVLVRTLKLVLAALSARGPFALVLEDLHWIDGASLDVLRQVMVDVPRLALLALATMRPERVVHWHDNQPAIDINLQPLPATEAVKMAQAVLGGRRLSADLEWQVTERAGGNPFFVEELIRSLDEGGELDERDGAIHLVEGAAERLPSTLTEVLLARLDRLDAEVRSLAQVASVIGRSFLVRLLAEVVEREVESLVRPLSNLQEAQIAFPGRGPDMGYTFKHATIHEVAYNTLLNRRRQALHGVIARTIASLYAEDEWVETIAYHYARSDRSGEAVEWLERAGDRAAKVYANEEALSHYDEALERLAEINSNPGVHARLDEKRGTVLATMGRYGEALPILEGAIEAYRELGDLESEARTTAAVGRLYADQGAPEEGLGRVHRMFQKMEGLPPSEGQAALAYVHTFLCHASSRYDEGLEAAERASQLTAALANDRLRADAELWRSMILNKLGKIDESVQAIDEAMRLAEASNNLECLRSCLTLRGVACAFSGELQRARELLERAVTIGQQVGDTVRVGFTIALLAGVDYHLGNWDRSRQMFEETISRNRAMGFSWFSAYPLVRLAELLLLQGKREEASRVAEEGVALLSRGSDLQTLRLGQRVLAMRDLEMGRPDEALARLQPVLDRPDLEEVDVDWVLPVLALAHLDQGEIERAEQVAAHAVDRGARHRNRIIFGEGLRVQGRIFAEQERWEDAERVLEEAIANSRRICDPFAEAHSLYLYGEVSMRQGKLAQGREHLEAALPLFQRLDARPFVERVEAMLIPDRS